MQRHLLDLVSEVDLALGVGDLLAQEAAAQHVHHRLIEHRHRVLLETLLLPSAPESNPRRLVVEIRVSGQLPNHGLLGLSLQQQKDQLARHHHHGHLVRAVVHDVEQLRVRLRVDRQAAASLKHTRSTPRRSSGPPPPPPSPRRVSRRTS